MTDTIWFSMPHAASWANMGHMDSPLPVTEYVTLGLPSCDTFLRTIPSDSSSFSCFDRILGVTPPIRLWSSVNLMSPSLASMQRMVVFHLPSMTDIAASTAQSYLGFPPGMFRYQNDIR
jgi:hypothetical protein